MTYSAAPDISNRTPFALEPAFLSDEEGRPAFVPIVKGTFAIDGTGALEIAEPRPVNLAGEHWGDPETSSYRYEPECAFMKPATDIILLGHAYPTHSSSVEVPVGIRVGRIQKVVTVVGDRHWEPGLSGRILMTSPIPFERLPLLYERAFGGCDWYNPTHPACELRNPVGTGFRVNWDGSEPTPLPNLEDPANRIETPQDRPAPAGFGFVSPNWLPRASFAGTYDEVWMAERSPLLPRDFDRRFFSAASPGLIAPGYLRGDERVTVGNASPRGHLNFVLPGVPAPRVDVTLRGRGVRTLDTQLDTLIVDTDDHLVTLIWRAYLTVSEVPRDVAAVVVA